MKAGGEKAKTLQEMEAFIFYFDVLGTRDEYLSDASVLTRLRDFQRSVRQSKFPVGCDWSTLITLYDNVWARINTAETIADVIALELAIDVMKCAKDNGFHEYFGACTKGVHTFDIIDKTLVGGSDPCDIRIQHIDSLSEPHMRGVFLEEWQRKLHKAGSDPVTTPCIWISEEVADYATLMGYKRWQGFDFSVLRSTLDFNEYPIDGRPWPFPEHSRFTAIGIDA
ncbi:MAG: hypothetical protein M1508_05330 [Nitrospirae bacterium]|nr:hypothetical protein [Nitrospirota bacterium]MCL5422169.1 hypothetical protein [Nitrospirota bacterium]